TNTHTAHREEETKKNEDAFLLGGSVLGDPDNGAYHHSRRAC
ncbi:unnamed protein product, partial [Urochloa humidicola]